MLSKLRNALSGFGGRIGLGMFLVAALVLMAWGIRGFGRSDGAAASVVKDPSSVADLTRGQSPGNGRNAGVLPAIANLRHDRAGM